MQEEVCIVPAPPVCLLPVCSYARLTAYFGILPTRSPILPERDFTPSSSARGATLAVMASSVSRILPGQEYSIVTAIAAGRAYCNAPPLIPQGQKRKMFLTANIFLKLFFDTEKATRLFRSGGGENTYLRFLIYIIAILIIYFRHSVPNTDMSLYILRRIGGRFDFFAQGSHKYA